MKKITVLLLIMCVCLSFGLLMSCDGGGGGGSGSDDDNTATGGDNGSGNTTSPWTVSYQCDLGGGGFGYVDFRSDGTYIYGDGSGGVKNPPDYDPSGTYTGDDPRGDGSIRVTGKWAGGGDTTNQLVTITGGIFDFAGLDMVRQ